VSILSRFFQDHLGPKVLILRMPQCAARRTPCGSTRWKTVSQTRRSSGGRAARQQCRHVGAQAISDITTATLCGEECSRDLHRRGAQAWHRQLAEDDVKCIYLLHIDGIARRKLQVAPRKDRPVNLGMLRHAGRARALMSVTALGDAFAEGRLKTDCSSKHASARFPDCARTPSAGSH